MLKVILIEKCEMRAIIKSAKARVVHNIMYKKAIFRGKNQIPYGRQNTKPRFFIIKKTQNNAIQSSPLFFRVTAIIIYVLARQRRAFYTDIIIVIGANNFFFFQILCKPYRSRYNNNFNVFPSPLSVRVTQLMFTYCADR